MRSKLFLAAAVLALPVAISSVASASGLIYYPFPYSTPTVNYASNGSGFNYSGFDPSQYSDLYWVVDAATAGKGPCIGVDGCDNQLSFDPTLNTATTMSNGLEYFTGSGGGLGTFSELVVTTSPLTPAASIPGLPAADGAAVHVAGNFSVNYSFFISTSCGNSALISTCTFGNARSVFDGWEESTHGSGDSLVSGEYGAFYYTPPSAVPLPPAAWLLLSGLAGLGFLGRKRLSGSTGGMPPELAA